MDPKTYELLRIMVTTRALLSNPVLLKQVEYDRLQAERLSSYIPRRLNELNYTPNDLAEALDIEIEFVDTLLDGNFPLSILSREMWSNLAAALQCNMSHLYQVANGVVG